MNWKNTKLPQASSSVIELEHFTEYARLALKNGLSSEQILNGTHAQDVKKLHPQINPQLEDAVYILEAELLENFNN